MAQHMREECLREFRAELVSLGGAVTLSICLLMSMMLLFVMLGPPWNGIQMTIFVLLTVASWLYLIDSATERLCLFDNAIVLTSIFGRKRRIFLHDLEALSFHHEGFNLEQGMESILFRLRGKDNERIPLGSCWRHRTLESFLHSVQSVMRDARMVPFI